MKMEYNPSADEVGSNAHADIRFNYHLWMYFKEFYKDMFSLI